MLTDECIHNHVLPICNFFPVVISMMLLYSGLILVLRLHKLPRPCHGPLKLRMFYWAVIPVLILVNYVVVIHKSASTAETSLSNGELHKSLHLIFKVNSTKQLS